MLLAHPPGTDGSPRSYAKECRIDAQDKEEHTALANAILGEPGGVKRSHNMRCAGRPTHGGLDDVLPEPVTAEEEQELDRQQVTILTPF
jgi:hypothetical protein